MSDVHHPTLRLTAYALPSPVSSVAALPLALFVPAFHADDLGVPLAPVGMAIAASRLLDVVTDPLTGIASDRLVGRSPRAASHARLGCEAWILRTRAPRRH